MTKDEFLEVQPGTWLTVETSYTEKLGVINYLLLFSGFEKDTDENIETGEEITFTTPFFPIMFDFTGNPSVVTLEGKGYSFGSLELIDMEQPVIEFLRKSTEDEIKVAEEIMSRNSITVDDDMKVHWDVEDQTSIQLPKGIIKL